MNDIDVRLLEQLPAFQREIYQDLRASVISQMEDAQKLWDQSEKVVKAEIEALNSRISKLERSRTAEPAVPSYIPDNKDAEDRYRTIQSRLDLDIAAASNGREVLKALVEAAVDQQPLVRKSGTVRPHVFIERRILYWGALGAIFGGAGLGALTQKLTDRRALRKAGISKEEIKSRRAELVKFKPDRESGPRTLPSQSTSQPYTNGLSSQPQPQLRLVSNE